jgi:hypothetical protein
MKQYINTFSADLRLGQFNLADDLLLQRSAPLVGYIKENAPLIHEAIAGLPEAGMSSSTLGALVTAASVLAPWTAGSLVNILLSGEGALIPQGLCPPSLYDRALGGIPLGEAQKIESASGQTLHIQPIVALRFSHIAPVLGPVFTAHYRHAFFYEEDIRVDQHLRYLASVLKGRRRLPCLDTYRSQKALLKRVVEKPLYHFPRRDQTGMRYSEIFAKYKLLSDMEITQSCECDENFPIAATAYYGNAREYYHPARHLVLRPSTELAAVVLMRSEFEVPEPIAIAAQLFEEGMLEVRETNADRHGILDTVEAGLSPLLLPMSPLPAEIVVRKTPRHDIKGSRHRDDIRAGRAYRESRADDNLVFGKTLVLQPIEQENRNGVTRYMNPEKQSLFEKSGHKLAYEDYSARIFSNPKEIEGGLDRLLKKHPDTKGILIFWPSKAYRHQAFEMACMKRMIPVQHSVLKGGKGLSYKIGNLISGMDRFSLTPALRLRPGMREKENPFSHILGIDVSHVRWLSVPAYPVLSSDGLTSALMPDGVGSFDSEASEKRPEDEIMAALELLIKNAKKGTKPSVLLLRDGWTREDYAWIQNELKGRLDLTVVGIRKGIVMGDFMDRSLMEDLVHYSVYAERQGNEFLFAAEARLEQNLPLPKLSLATVILNPLDLPKKGLADLLMDLCFEQRTTERAVGGLPHPLSYADRFAADLRSKLLDRIVATWLDHSFPDEVNEAKGHMNLIYRIVHNFVQHHPNGGLMAL